MTVCDLRKQIDEIDNALLNLINNRLELAKKIGQLKRKGDCKIIDDFRENEVLHRLNSINRGPIKSSTLHKIFTCVFAASRAIQKKKCDLH